MNHVFVRFVCRLLIASLVWLPLQASADLIATDQAIAGATATSARAAVAAQLETYGIARDAARERAAALGDAEALALADRIGEAPAGAGVGGIGLLLILAFLIWRFTMSDQAKAEGAKK